MSGPTIAETIDRVRDMLDEEQTTGGRWSQKQLRRWINDGMRDIARVTRHFRDRATISLTMNVGEYTVPDNVLEIELAYYLPGDGQYIPLQPRQFESMDLIWGSRQDQSGGYPMLYTVWGFSPNLKLRLYPVPPVTGHDVSLMVVRFPAQIALDGSADGTVIDFPEAWLDAIVSYAEYRARRMDGDPRWQEARGEYTEIRDQLTVMGDYLNAPREITPDPYTGWVPNWLSQF
jgi:hypothetical protein